MAVVYAVVIALDRKRNQTRWAFSAGMAILAIESILNGIAQSSADTSELVYWQSWRLIATACISGPWIVFSFSYARGRVAPRRRWKSFVLLALAIVPPLVALLFRDDIVVAIRPNEFAFQTILELGWPALVSYVALLLASVIAITNFERTYRAAVGTMRWRIKFMLLALGLFFVVRIYTSTQALTVRQFDPNYNVFDSAALCAAVIVMLRSLLRAGHFEMDVYPSPSVIRGSVTILFVGAYLVIVGLASKLASYFGNEGTIGANALIVLFLLIVLAALLQSEKLKLKLRQFVSRNFERPFYDYRSAWRNFTNSSSIHLNSGVLCRVLSRQIADLFQAHAVSVWSTRTDGESLICEASTSVAETERSSMTPSPEEARAILDYFQKQAEPVPFEKATDAWAVALRRCHPKTFETGGSRIALALRSQESFLGVLIVGDRVNGSDHAFGSQDLDMLRCVANHLASGLLTIQLSSRLAQSRELEAFRTMAAFFVHDLKNAASTLNLMLPNLPLHWDNPEFRTDALRGITKTVTRINSLIKRMGELRNELKLSVQTTDLNDVAQRSLQGWEKVSDVSLEKSFAPLVPVQIDPEQITTVLTNLVLNARDATIEGKSLSGKVRVETKQTPGWVVVSVSDNGCGMSPAFIANSLFKPFQTTKKNGLGIGMFQSKMIVEAHGGRFTVQSVVGSGTTFQVFLPSTMVVGPSKILPLTVPIKEAT